MMRSRNHYGICVLPLLVAMTLGGCSQNPQASSGPESADKTSMLSRIFASTHPAIVPEGTELVVELNQSISSDENRPGDSFEGTLVAPIVVDGKTVIPEEAKVHGHVVDAKGSGRLKGVARLEVTLDSLDVNGKNYDVETGDISRSGQNHNKRNGELIGGGAGVGALIGAIAGGGKGALIGGAAGAGAGTGAAAYTGKKDVRIPAESRLSFSLARPVTITVKS